MAAILVAQARRALPRPPRYFVPRAGGKGHIVYREGIVMRAYRKMAHDARYRPCAPSDGMGNIVGILSDPEDLEHEAERYESQWLEDERADDFFIGCPDYGDKEALVFTVEAARNICGMQQHVAIRLLEMAVADLRSRHQP